jgi:Ca2+-binding EF-hand superfamily protein
VFFHFQVQIFIGQSKKKFSFKKMGNKTEKDSYLIKKTFKDINFDELFNKFDKDKSGYLDKSEALEFFEEYFLFLLYSLSDTKYNETKKEKGEEEAENKRDVCQIIFKPLETNLKAIAKDLFLGCDNDKNGKIDKIEFQTILNINKEEILEKYLKKYCTNSLDQIKNL